MRIAFLFPGSGPQEALDNWVFTIGRHTRHEVFLVRQPNECLGFDCAFVLTETNSFPQQMVDGDIAYLRAQGVPFGVVHNCDRTGKRHGAEVSGIPTPGHYPSFCWTQRGQERLRAHAPVLLRQPVLPPIVPPFTGDHLLVGTFGHIEPKKGTFEMGRWAKKNGVPFVAVGPTVLTGTYSDYLADLHQYNIRIHLHTWLHQIEELAPLVVDCSHFLFVLPEAKKGTGGSPTSPRFASLFNRPVIVVDDEGTFGADRYYVYQNLDAIRREDLATMGTPHYHWSPDAYLDELCRQTLAFWKKAND